MQANIRFILVADQHRERRPYWEFLVHEQKQ